MVKEKRDKGLGKKDVRDEEIRLESPCQDRRASQKGGEPSSVEPDEGKGSKKRVGDLIR